MVGKDLIMATLFGSGGGSSGSGGGSDSLIDRSIAEVSSNVEQIGEYAFYKCQKMLSADFPKAKTVNNRAFSNCIKLETLSIPVAETLSGYACYSNSGLREVNAPNVVSIGDDAFSGCSNLQKADFPLATSVGNRAFQNCNSLKEISLPVANAIQSSTCSYCSNITKAIFPSAASIAYNGLASCGNLKSADFSVLTKIENQAFSNDYLLTALILRSETLCVLSVSSVFVNCYHMLGTTNASYNPTGVHDGYVYVPSALVEEYQSATNWSSLALQFRALEDYTVDGTITGDLDESKI